MRIEVRSRRGNAILGVLGALYLVSAIVLFVYDLMQTWGAASLIDRTAQIALAGCALAGLFFLLNAARNLGVRLPRHEAPLHREDAATVR